MQGPKATLGYSVAGGNTSSVNNSVIDSLSTTTSVRA